MLPKLPVLLSPASAMAASHSSHDRNTCSRRGCRWYSSLRTSSRSCAAGSAAPLYHARAVRPCGWV
eukprot:6012309-Prymnesium_polylepis.2